MAVLRPKLWFATARWLQVSGDLLRIWLWDAFGCNVKSPSDLSWDDMICI